jgi:hypothetical protein
VVPVVIEYRSPTAQGVEGIFVVPTIQLGRLGLVLNREFPIGALLFPAVTCSPSIYIPTVGSVRKDKVGPFTSSTIVLFAVLDTARTLMSHTL